MGTRRSFLGGLSLALVGLGGCGGPGGDAEPDADVVVGPDSRLAYEPAELTVPAGTTVTWVFDSSGHNVSCVPAHAASASLPDGAAPFSSYEGDEKHRTSSRGETFVHAFEVPGTYEYVCIPHESAGMTGRVVVEG